MSKPTSTTGCPEGFTRCPCGSPYGEECFKGFCEGCGIEESKRIIRDEERGYCHE